MSASSAIRTSSLNATLLVLAFLTLMGVFIAINHRRPDLDVPDATEQAAADDPREHR